MDLVEKINILGPWIHGYFDLGNGIVIEDRDILQKRRLFQYRKYFIDIITKHYGRDKLTDKTLCDVGCNAGYFLFELYKRFRFRSAVGYEPRTSNLAKARFIARHFRLPAKRYSLKKLDILNIPARPPVYDIVLFPGVLHHVDDHLLALGNLFRMTGELCIIDTLVLPEAVNTPLLGRTLELKDDRYGHLGKDYFGAVGYKYEDNKLDGSTLHAGVVGIPTTKALEMMLRHVGFTDVEIYKDWRQLKKEVYFGRLPRDIYSAVVVAGKRRMPKRTPFADPGEKYLRDLQHKEMDVCVPEKIIRPCYDYVAGRASLKSLPALSRCICESQAAFYSRKGERAQKKFLRLFSDKPYFFIVQTFKHAPEQKIAFEAAKTFFHKGLPEQSRAILEPLVKTVNLDWRTVYRSYHLLSLIFMRTGQKGKAREYNVLCLKTYGNYVPAQELKKRLAGAGSR